MISDYSGFYDRIAASNRHDLYKCRAICDASQTYLKESFQKLPYEVVSRFFQWISFYFSCLGAEFSAWDPWASLKEAELEKPLEEKQKEIFLFLDEIRKKMRTFRQQKDEKHISIVVLTTLSCGNMGYYAPNRPRGHYSPAVAIMKTLEENHISATLLDVDGEKCDPVRLPLLDSQTRYARLRDAVAAHSPNLIISTICHEENWALRFDVDVPMIGIQTDYSLYKGIATVTPFTTAAEHADFFEMARYGSKIRQLILADSDGLGQRIESIIGEVYPQIVQQYIFPTRPSFVRQSDPASLLQLRQEMGILSEEQVVIFTSGSIDGEDMTKLVPCLNETEVSFLKPLYIVMICGENKISYNLLERYLKESPHHPQMRFKLEGRVEEEQMAHYGQVAAWDNGVNHGCMVGKAGGSTVSENLVLGLYTLMLPSGGCEEEASNRIHMNNCFLGTTLESKKTFIPQLKSILESSHPRPKSIEAWAIPFMKNVSEMMKTKLPCP